MINQNFIYLGIFLQSIGGLDYLIGTIKGKVKPNRVSLFLWAAAPLIAFYAQIQQGVGPEAFVTFIVGFIPLLVFCASFVNKKSVWKITILDIVCGLFSLSGLLLWFVTKSGNVAILFSIIADLLAGIPTVIKSFNNPETESVFIYFFGTINVVIGLLVIKTWNFENYAFLIYLLIISLIFTVLIQFKIGAFFKKI